MTFQAFLNGCGQRQPAVVGLHRTAGDQCVCPLFKSFGNYEFEFSGFVSATGKTEEIVSLHNEAKEKEKAEKVAKEKNYIPIEDYREICGRHKVTETESQDQLIRFLHDLGVVLNFQDPEDAYGQNDPFVLNPEFV